MSRIKNQNLPKPISELFKPGIIFMVLITGLAGYALSYEVEDAFTASHLLLFLFGLGILSAGSFAINQAQEGTIDSQMPRTQQRPIPTGKITERKAYIIGFLMLGVGLGVLKNVSMMSMWLGLLTAILYTVFYTLYWKRKWSFGAVPGALPGAMPVVIGFAANNSNIFDPQCMYMFLVMFLWQMPHFWALAIRFKDDYKKGGIPVLPSSLGVDRTLFHIGLYVFVYVALAFASPFFVEAGYMYFLIVIPFALKVLWEFKKYFNQKAQESWLPFFMWVNFSLLVFLTVPVLEKWGSFILSL